MSSTLNFLIFKTINIPSDKLPITINTIANANIAQLSATVAKAKSSWEVTNISETEWLKIDSLGSNTILIVL